MKNALEFAKKNVLCILFGTYYLVGLFCFQDYGVHWDDFTDIKLGTLSFDYIFHGNPDIFSDPEKYHGPFFQMLLIAVERLLHVAEGDWNSIFRLRHFVTFNVFFASVVVFYYLLKTYFNKTLSIVGCLFLILSPRFFAESFYNSKDVGLLSFFIFATYTLVLFLEKKNWIWLILHALASAFLIDIRIVGVVMPCATIVFFVLAVLQSRNYTKLLLLLVYVLLLVFFVVLFWPTLWASPYREFKAAYDEMKLYPWFGHVFFLGKPFWVSELPWYYLPLWLLISTPVLYSLLFIVGCFAYTKWVWNDKIKTYQNSFLLHISVAFFSFSLLSVIVLKAIVYDGWRHLYFIYPFFLVIALLGLQFLLKIKNNVRKMVFGVLVLNSIYLAVWIGINHPFENVYFNLVVRNTIGAGTKFEKDYWGLSYKQALEYLAKTETKTPIKVAGVKAPLENNLRALDAQTHTKFILCTESDTTFDYYLTNYRYGIYPSGNLTKVDAIKVDGITIIGFYKR